MKKLTALLLTTLLMLSLAACGKGPADRNATERTQPQSEPQTTQSGKQDDPQSNGITLLCDDSSSFSSHFGTASGYYYFTESGKIQGEKSGLHLMYIDYATKKEVYLCSDSGCQHNSETCTSVFSMEEFGTDCLPFVHGNWLYVLNREFDQDGSTAMDLQGGTDDVKTESMPVSLYRMGLDGSVRQKVFTFPENTTAEKLVFSDGDDLWFVTKKLSFQQDGNATYTTSSDRALSRLDLSEGKIVSTIPLEFGDHMHHKVIGGTGSQFILCSVEYPQGMSEQDVMRLTDDDWKKLYKNSSTVCSALDVTSGEKKEIYRQANRSLSPSFAVRGGYLYASDYENNGILKIDLASGEKTTLAELSQNYIYDTLGDALCCVNVNESQDSTLYFVDMETGEVRHSTLTNQSLGWQLDILADAGDQVLVVYDYEAIPRNDGSYEILQFQYGLISISDLYHSNENYEPIAMVGSGK